MMDTGGIVLIGLLLLGIGIVLWVLKPWELCLNPTYTKCPICKSRNLRYRDAVKDKARCLDCGWTNYIILER